jgi:thiamine biosynthesis lipoprotein
MKKYNYLIPLAAVVFLLVFTLTRQRGEVVPECSDTRLMMDTFVEIRVWGRGEVAPEAALDSAFAAVAAIWDIFGDGVITAGEAGALRTPDADSIMARSRAAWKITGGLFDPTIGAVSRLWEFHHGSAPPEADSVEAALESVGLEKYIGGGDLQIADGLVLDIGGVAKGYALDLAADVLRRLGFKAALLNAGGDIKIVGEKPGGGKWRIAVRHPREGNALLGCLEVGPVSIATSGDYERSFIHEGTLYHHIMDPRTGMPSRGAVSVTVIGQDAGLCDALATGLFVMGSDRAVAAAESLPGIEAVLVLTEDMEVVTTSGIAGSFERLK